MSVAIDRELLAERAAIPSELAQRCCTARS
jgi:hypothetical protein